MLYRRFEDPRKTRKKESLSRRKNAQKPQTRMCRTQRGTEYMPILRMCRTMIATDTIPQNQYRFAEIHISDNNENAKTHRKAGGLKHRRAVDSTQIETTAK